MNKIPSRWPYQAYPQMSPSQAQLLKDLADEQGISRQELIRRAVKLHFVYGWNVTPEDPRSLRDRGERETIAVKFSADLADLIHRQSRAIGVTRNQIVARAVDAFLVL